MRDFLPFIVTGIATGAIGAGMVGVGLVLTYKTSGILNFAHGALATMAAYLFYWLHVDHSMGWLPAAAIAVVVAGPLLGFVMERVASQLAPQTTALKIVGTIGIVLLVQGLATIKYGATTIRVDQFLPSGTETFRLFDVVITYDKVIVTIVAVVAVVLLYALFRYTRAGVSMRAVVDDPDLVAMQGTNPQRVRRGAWVIGATFAALSGVLIVPLIGLDAITLTFLVVQAFGAAAIGAFSSIPLTFIGGILIGITAAISKRYVVDVSWLSGFPAALPFIVLFVALLVLPRRKLVPPNLTERRPALQYRAPATIRVAVAAIVLVPLLLVPELVGTKLIFFTTGLVTVVMLLSLGLLVRTSGQVSLCHAAFAAIGATAFSQFHVDHDIPWVLAVVLAGLVVVPVGALVAIPAIRLSGLYLALATFGFGILVQQLFYNQPYMFTAFAEGRRMPRPDFAGTQRGFYYVVLAVAVLVGLLVAVIHRSRLGRMLQGMSAAPTAVTALGLSTNVSKVVVFCASAFLAGIAGVMLGVTRNFASASDPFFISFNSLILLAMLALAPFSEPWYAFVPAIGAVVPAYWTGANSTHWINTLFGFFAVMVAVQGGHPVMPSAWRARLDRLGRRKKTRPAANIELRPAATSGGSGLVVEDLVVRFGGLVAVNKVSLSAPLARVTGLIGPNGAGKTTTFDACSGLNRRFSGKIFLHDEDITRLSPSARGRSGLGRTFQRTELGDALTVIANVRLGAESSLAGANPLAQLASRPDQRQRVEEAAWGAMAFCGIEDLADMQAGALSTGQRRLVELARVVAGDFDMLLLDEPSAGLDKDETARFAALLRRVVDERGVGVLLVEHDMSLVMGVCDYIYVLDFGQIIAHGSPEEVMRSDVVRVAYLGTEPLPTEAVGSDS
jgi:ABC-type branched-subunit amino acid transport system ATPase component/branched-subunit amino acid ABC-type transport system permease component